MLIVFILLFVIFCARVTLEILIFGTVIGAAVYFFCVRFMGYDPRTDLKIVKNFGWAVKYAALLVWEIILANIQVTQYVFSREKKVDPKLVFFRTDLKSDLAKMTLANCITLTPGTITVAVNDDVFCVHCLNGEFAAGIEESSFIKALRKVEGKEEGEQDAV